ncbi:cytidylyltransferase domain-containing protein [Chloroflexota bacterium]
MKKTVILVQTRVKSTRLPKKVLHPIEDRLLVEHVIERLKRASIPDEILMCTSTHPDDQILVEIARNNNIGWSTGSEEDVLERFIQAAEESQAEVVVRATGENPLVDPYSLDRAIQEHLQSGAEYTSMEDFPIGVKAEIIDVSALKKAHRLADNPEKSEYMTLYFKDDFFRVHAIEAEEPLRRPSYRLTVDTPEDMELIRKIYKALYKPGEIIPLEDVISFLDTHPEAAAINSRIIPKKVKREVLMIGQPKIRLIRE